MKKLAKAWTVTTVLAAAGLMTVAQDASAVPSFARRYGEECSTCHSMWGALTPAGLTFKLSGYRAIFGKDMTPVTPDEKISKNVTLPTTLPLSFVTGVGYDVRTEKRDQGAGGTNTTANGSTISLEDASIFMTSPLGNHLSTFVEFPMYEARPWEFTPTGNYEARFNVNGRQVKFATEQPGFEVAKFFWNNPIDGLSRDSFNLLAGITQLPLAYPSGKVRLAVNQYLIYERTPLDLISPRKVSGVVGAENPADAYFHMGEAQGLAEIFGMKAIGASVTDVNKKETPWVEYHLGISNGADAKAAYHSQKDVYGRAVLRYYGQSVGLFGLTGADGYSDDLRTTADLGAGNANVNGIMSGSQNANKMSRRGFDFALSLVPFGTPVWLENQYMSNRDSDPTGFGKEFKWTGGFHQLNWKMSKTSIGYIRYDWIKGDPYNDTGVTINGRTGITRSTPKENDWILGWQHLIDENTKLIAEYRTHTFDDTATGAAIAGLVNTNGVNTSGNAAHLKDNGFTIRMMFGF